MCVGSHSLLQQDDPEYNMKRQKLAEYYHPLEFNPAIPIDEKTKLMEECILGGERHMTFLIEGGLTYDAIRNSVANANIAFQRLAFVEFFELLRVKSLVEIFFSAQEENVPVLIFLAGLADIIEEVLMQKLRRSLQEQSGLLSNRWCFERRPLTAVLKENKPSTFGTMVGDRKMLFLIVRKSDSCLKKERDALDMAGASSRAILVKKDNKGKE
nr:7-methylguanosine phosphate-specific 5'-nucleotidase A-like [Ipomoea batatas]